MIFFIKLSLTVFLVFFLPGLIINLITLRDKRLHIFEAIPYAFGVSFIVVSMVGFFSFVLHLNIQQAFQLFIFIVFVSGLICIVGIIKKRIRPLQVFYLTEGSLDRVSKTVVYLTVFLIIILTLITYEITMPHLGQEDKVTLIPAQRILVSEGLDYKEMLFKRGDISVYLIPLYAFIIALMSQISGLEIVQVYNHLRYVYAMIVLLNVFALARAFLPLDWRFQYISIIVASTALINGWGGYSTGAAYGQFIPFTQYQDLAVCVILPIAIVFYYRTVREGWYWSMVTFLLSASLFFIHIREVLILLIIFVSITTAMFAINRDKLIALRGVAVIGLLFIVGLLLRQVQSGLISPHIIEWDNAIKGAVIDLISMIQSKGTVISYLYPPMEDQNQLFLSYNIFYENPYYLLAFVVLPIIISMRERDGMFASGAVLLSIAIITMIPVVSLLTVKYTYIQFLYGGPAYFGSFPLVYVLFAFVVYMGIKFAHEAFGSGVSILTIVMIIAVFYMSLMLVPKWVYKISPLIFYLWLFVGSLTFALMRFSKTVQDRLLRVYSVNLGGGYFLATCIVFYLVSSSTIINDAINKLQPSFEKKKTSANIFPYRLEDYHKTIKDKVISVVHWDRWYSNNVKDMPWYVVEYVRREIPNPAVFAVPVGLLYDFATFTGKYVYTSGSYNSMLETDFFERLYKMRHGKSLHDTFREQAFLTEYLKKKAPRLLVEHKNIQYYVALIAFTDDLMREEQPIFNKKDTPEFTLRLIREFGIEYIYAPPDWYEHLEELSMSLKGHLKKVYEREGCAIYKVSS